MLDELIESFSSSFSLSTWGDISTSSSIENEAKLLFKYFPPVPDFWALTIPFDGMTLQ